MRSNLGRCRRRAEAAAKTARSGRGAASARVVAVRLSVRDLDAVGNSNDFNHLQHTYIHLFAVLDCRASEYVSGTPLAWSPPQMRAIGKPAVRSLAAHRPFPEGVYDET